MHETSMIEGRLEVKNNMIMSLYWKMCSRHVMLIHMHMHMVDLNERILLLKNMDF